MICSQLAKCLSKGVDVWVSIQREGSSSENQCSFATGFILLLFHLVINLNKNVGDMFIPFARDPDLGSTVTSFHTRIRTKIDSQHRPRHARVSQGTQAKALSENKKIKKIAFITGSSGTCFHGDLHVNCGKFHVISVYNPVM